MYELCKSIEGKLTPHAKPAYGAPGELLGGKSKGSPVPPGSGYTPLTRGTLAGDSTSPATAAGTGANNWWEALLPTVVLGFNLGSEPFSFGDP